MLNWLAKIKCALDFLARFCKRKAHRRVLHRSCVFTYRFAFMKHRIYFYYASINKQMMQWRRPIWSLALHIGESRNASLRAFRVWTVFDLLLAYRDKILSTNSVFSSSSFFSRWKYIWCEKTIRSRDFSILSPPTPTRRLFRGEKYVIWVSRDA